MQQLIDKLKAALNTYRYNRLQRRVIFLAETKYKLPELLAQSQREAREQAETHCRMMKAQAQIEQIQIDLALNEAIRARQAFSLKAGIDSKEQRFLTMGAEA